MAELVDRTGLGLIAGGALVYFGRDALFAGARERDLAKLAGLGLGLAGVLKIVSSALSRGERILDVPVEIVNELKDAVLPGPGPVPGTGVSVPILGGSLVPPRELPPPTQPPPGESFGIVVGPLVSPVVANITDPVDGGTSRRAIFDSAFPVTIDIQNFTDREQEILLEAVVRTTTVFGKVDPVQQRIGIVRVPARDTITGYKARLDSGSRFELGDPTVTVQLLVNKKPTQSVTFEVE